MVEVKLIHTSDGTLKADDPWIVEDTRIRIIKEDPEYGWSEKYIGSTGIITKECVDECLAFRKRSKERQHVDTVYAYFTMNDGKDLGLDYIATNAVEVIDG